jgi:hypothetical protein
VIDADGKVGARLEGSTLTLVDHLWEERELKLNPILGFHVSDRFGAAFLNAQFLSMSHRVKGGSPGQHLPGQVWQHRMMVAADHIELTDRDGKTRAILGASQLRVSQTEEVRQRPESSLVFLNSDGKVIWSAP